jgi:hypothetical protein
MAYKIVRALQSFDHNKSTCKKGDQIEVEEKEAEQLIARGLAELGTAPQNAGDTRSRDAGHGVTVGHGQSAGPTPDNKMAPQHYSDK